MTSMTSMTSMTDSKTDSKTDSMNEIVVNHLLKMATESGKMAHFITLFDFALKNDTPTLKDLLIHHAYNITHNILSSYNVNECKETLDVTEAEKCAKQLLVQFGIDTQKYLFIQTAQRLGAVCAIECPDENYEDYLLQIRFDRNKTELEMMEAYLRGELYCWYSPLEDRIQLMKKILKKKGIPFHYRLMAQYFKWVKTCDGGNRYVKIKAFVDTL